MLPIGEWELDARQHVETRAQKSDLSSKDGQLARLLVLGVRPAGVSCDANDVATAEVGVLLLEWDAILLSQLGLADNL